MTRPRLPLCDYHVIMRSVPITGEYRTGDPVPLESIEYSLPVAIVSEANARSRTWKPGWRRSKQQRETVRMLLRRDVARWPLPARITLTRIGWNKMDAHDNLQRSMKAVVDEIAGLYGYPDKDARFDWQYAQELNRKVIGLRVRIESRPA